MKRTLTVVAICLLALVSSYADAGKKAGGAAPQADEGTGETRLVSGIMAIDPAIASVRPASMGGSSDSRFKTVWMPAVTVRDKTPVDSQLSIAQRVADFVVNFQGGVPTEGTMGGIIAFVEGERDPSAVGQVFYKIENPGAPVEVWVGARTTDENGSVSCCEEAGRIGKISGAHFQAEPVAKLVPVVTELAKPKKK